MKYKVSGVEASGVMGKLSILNSVSPESPENDPRNAQSLFCIRTGEVQNGSIWPKEANNRTLFASSASSSRNEAQSSHSLSSAFWSAVSVPLRNRSEERLVGKDVRS